MRHLLSHDLILCAVLTIGAAAIVVSMVALGMRWHMPVVIMFGLPTAFVLAQLPQSLLFVVVPAGGGLGLAGFALFGAAIEFFLLAWVAVRWFRRQLPK